MLKVLALCACFNRGDRTENSVRLLLEQASASGLDLKILVVDNNSTDDTRDRLFSLGRRVEVVCTPKDMFWAESMQFGFSRINALEAFDSFLFFNDDIELAAGALPRLVSEFRDLSANCRSLILVGSFGSRFSVEEVTYGGFRQDPYFTPRLRRVMPGSCPTPVDSFNMNLVIVSAECVSQVGFPSGPYRHSLLDVDYGLMASASGCAVMLASGMHGVCEKNSIDGTWRDLERNIFVRFHLMLSPKGRPLNERFKYLLRNYSPVWLPCVFTPILQLLADEVRRSLRLIGFR